MSICNKQNLSNICGPIHLNVQQNWGWVEEIRYYKKARVYFLSKYSPIKFYDYTLMSFGF